MGGLKFYFASRFEDRFRLRLYREQLQVLGHICTSSWLDKGAEVAPYSQGLEAEIYPASSRRDLDDVRAADILVLFNDAPVITLRGERGGRHVELGYMVGLMHGLGSERHIILVGERTNIFHHLREINYVVETWYEAYNLIKELYTLDHSSAQS